MNNYKENSGVIFLTSGTAGKSLYEIEQQAPYVAAEDDEHFGFLNIDIDDKTVKGTFYANKRELGYYYVDYKNNIIDHFTISKTNAANNEFEKL